MAGDRGVTDELGGVPGAASGSGSGGPSQFEFGVDPSLDPELAMVRPLTPCRHIPSQTSALL